MPKFAVKLEETTSYTIVVEAETEEAAAEIAEQKFVESDDIRQFPCTVHERDVVDINPV